MVSFPAAVPFQHSIESYVNPFGNKLIAKHENFKSLLGHVDDMSSFTSD
jgi:hypothetical protein